jgi:hypothetical protein
MMEVKTPLSNAQSKLIQAQLAPGEVVRWEGCESKKRTLLRRLVTMGLYAGCWTFTGALTVTWIVIHPDLLNNTFAQTLPVLALSVLWASALYWLLREIVNPTQNGPHLYAVTNRRAFLIAVGRTIRVWSYGPEATRSAKIQRRPDGSGNIIFERSLLWTTDPEGRPTPMFITVGFSDVRKIDEVARWLEKIS